MFFFRSLLPTEREFFSAAIHGGCTEGAGLDGRFSLRVYKRAAQLSSDRACSLCCGVCVFSLALKRIKKTLFFTEPS